MEQAARIEEAASAEEGAKRWAGGSFAALRAKLASMAMPLAIGVAVAGLAIAMANAGRAAWRQSKTMRAQAAMEADPQVRRTTAAMLAEQDWLVGQRLAERVRVAPLVFGQEPPEPEGAFVGGYAEMGGWNLNEDAQKWLSWTRFARWGWGIDPGWRVRGAGPGGFAQDSARTYRHEQGHARIRILDLKAEMPQAWPAGVREALSPWMGRASDGIARPSGGEQGWRTLWLAKARDEEFADAFSCLSVARRGAAAMRECALGLHALRTFPSKEMEEGESSLVVAGEEHAVEAASFIVGQLDAGKVARLDSKGLDELAGKVADAGLAWQLARMAEANRFFEGGGEAWWLRMAAGAGQGEKKAREEWSQWRGAALAKRPEAAFGSWSWEVGGMLFSAKGLREGDAGPCWAYDGYCGVRVAASWQDPSSGAVLSRTPFKSLGTPRSDPEMSKPERMEGVRRGEASALMSHRAMAKLMGADMGAEGERLAAQLAEDPSYAKRALGCLGSGECAPEPERQR